MVNMVLDMVKQIWGHCMIEQSVETMNVILLVHLSYNLSSCSLLPVPRGNHV